MKKYLLHVVYIALIVAFSLGGFYIGTKQSKVVYTEKVSPVRQFPHSEVTFDNYLIVLNEYRISKGLPQFITDPELTKYAQARAEEIEQAKAGITHQTSLGSFWEYTQSKRFKFASECVQGWYNDTYKAVDGFKNSPTHNDAIVSPTSTHVGIGIKGGIIVLELGQL